MSAWRMTRALIADPRDSRLPPPRPGEPRPPRRGGARAARCGGGRGTCRASSAGDPSRRSPAALGRGNAPDGVGPRPAASRLSPGGSVWIQQADPRYAGDTFSKDRVGLCEVAFRAESRAQVDALARDVAAWGGTILHPPREYPEYVPGYYAVFFADPDGIKLELVHIPGCV